jgi:isoleucyl-tRNA synthetase
MDAVFERLTIWLSPLISFTTEEAWHGPPSGGRLQQPARFPRDAGQLAQ